LRSGYNDGDWTANLEDRKNKTSFVFYLGELTFTLSTCEVEYTVAASCVCHAVWLRKLLKEL
jgi:hypothetical protein